MHRDRASSLKRGGVGEPYPPAGKRVFEAWILGAGSSPAGGTGWQPNCRCKLRTHSSVVERLVHTEDVGGSSPSESTGAAGRPVRRSSALTTSASCRETGCRATRHGACGVTAVVATGSNPAVRWVRLSRSWVPRRPMVGIAQLVERRVVVADVAGSSPVIHPREDAVQSFCK